MRTSERAKNLKQSGIRAASTRCAAIGGINLGQGICDLPVDNVIKQSAIKAIEADYNIYSPCEGLFSLREALAKKLNNFNQIQADPETEVVITHGSTGAFVSVVTTLFDPGDEVILFEPFYSYHKNILELKGCRVITVPVDLFDLTIDMDALKKAITPSTRGIVICTPCNPTGKVYSREELVNIGTLAKTHGLWAITDEIYEYITYPGFSHVSMASLEDFREFTLTISGFSKTYNMTGWRLGYVTGPAHIMRQLALVQDILYVCPATPLQQAVIQALELETDYYKKMAISYLNKRTFVVEALQGIGFKVIIPQGSYYLMADFSQLGFADDETAANILLEKAKVSTVPGRNFYQNPEDGRFLLRFCYALDDSRVKQALQMLQEKVICFS